MTTWPYRKIFSTLGDVTASITTGLLTIVNKAVTYSKIQDISAESKLLGRGQGSGLGSVQEIVLGTNLSMSGITLNANNPNLNETFLTETNEIVDLPNSRRVLAGSHISFDDSVVNVRTVNVPGSALTRVNDTNITLTLGGTPTTALLDAVSLTLGWTGQLSVPRGGTGFASYAVGDILYADTTTTLAKLVDVATGNALISGGVGVAPLYGKIGLTTHVSGILPIANGGTNASTFTNGQVVFYNGTSLVGDTDLTFLIDTLTATKLLAPTSVSTPSIITASGALTITPAAGSGLNVNLSTTGDFAVNTNNLYVDTSTGNVGIGTTNPSAGRLQVVGAAVQWGAIIDGSTTAGSSGLLVRGGNSSSDTAFQVKNASNNADYLFIRGDGNVGIGTNAPKSKVHIEGTSAWIIQDEQDTDPTTTELDANDSIAVYNKNNKFVISYNNAGTITYLTIPLDAATITWSQGTTAP